MPTILLKVLGNKKSPVKVVYTKYCVATLREYFLLSCYRVGYQAVTSDSVTRVTKT